MPKLKTRRAAAKRFRITKTGKVLRHQAGMRHLLVWKSKSKKMARRKAKEVSPTDVRRVQAMLPGR